MIPPLPTAFLAAPIAHRGLHDLAAGRPENGRAAIRAAMAAGYGIEIDLQPGADGRALVFHDDTLDRLTGRSGPVATLTAAQAAATPLAGGDGEGIPTLTEVLELVAGRVPLLIEIKDQTGKLAPGPTVLETATATALQGYLGPVAVMSFNPHCIAEMARIAPLVPRGLVTCDFDPAEWGLDEATCAPLREIADFDRVGAAFISHDAADLRRPRVAGLRAAGTPVLCWTIRSADAEAAARIHADNVTFEGYLAALPA
jgi:glycerophosphoryl diester phosphodiesterase